MKTKKLTVCVVILIFLVSAVSMLHAEEQKKINLNAATAEELEKIPGLNKELVKKIIDLREENGEFVDMEELLDIPGINIQLLRQLKKYIFIESLDGCNC